MRGNRPKPTEGGLRGESLKDHVEPGSRVSNDEIHDDSQPNPRRLLLTNKEATKSQSSDLQVYDDRNTKPETKLEAARAEQIGRKWQSIVRRRQEERARTSRKEHDSLRRNSNLRQKEKFNERRTATNSKQQLRIGESNLARVRSDGSQSDKSSSSSPSRVRSGSRGRSSIPSPQNIGTKKSIPPWARWTKIDQKLVSPQALEEAHERFEERSEYVIVLRVLTREEIEAYAVRTQEIRGMWNCAVLILSHEPFFFTAKDP